MSSQENPDNTILPEENLTEYPDMPKMLGNYSEAITLKLMDNPRS